MHLLKTETDKKRRACVLNNFLEGFRTTVFRQTMFAEFEYIAHTMAEKGQPLTKDALTKVYYDLNKLYYGGACKVDKEVQYEWMRIPHFYSSFYVYKYATGFCAAVALARNVLSGDPEKIAAYRKFLTLGGSMTPIEELKIAGVDLTKPETVKNALSVFADTLDELEALLEEI